jgi:hypothetical protein
MRAAQQERMLYLFIALTFFFDSVFLHLIACRQAKTEGLLLKKFLMIAGVNLLVCWAGFWFISKNVPAGSGLWAVPLFAVSTAIYLLLIPIYLVFYFSTQQMSPSKKVMLLLFERPRSSAELEPFFTDEEMIIPRIQDLLMTGCMAQQNGRYVLTSSGVHMAQAYAFYQGLLGRKKGG